MILQALCGYYERLEKENEDTPRYGFCTAQVSGCIELDNQGNVSGVISLLNEKKKKVPLVAPNQHKRTKLGDPYFCCDKADYFLAGEEAERAVNWESAKALHKEILSDVDDDGARAILAFFEGEPPAGQGFGRADLLVFRLEGDGGAYLHERPAIRRAWERYFSKRTEGNTVTQCLVTGEQEPMALIHKGIEGNATIVSFKQEAFRSYGKLQGGNAPVSLRAEFQYTTALKALANDPRHYFRLGGDKVVFWAERSAGLEEDVFGDMMYVSAVDEISSEQIRANLTTLYSGKMPMELDHEVQFCLLGYAKLSDGRVGIRFFYRERFGHILESYARHIQDCMIARGKNDPIALTPLKILRETAVEYKSENIPPLLESALLRSIFWDTAYPYTLYMAILRRVRADARVNRCRAAVLKGYLNRQDRLNQKEEMLTVGLNPQETNQAYLLGRMLAVFQKAQYDALGQVNADVVDKYLNAALAAPSTVFTTLATLFEKHLKKIEHPGAVVNHQKLMQEIHDKIPSSGYPQTLSAEEQGRFLIGYYHQRQAFFSSTKDENTNAEQEAS